MYTAKYIPPIGRRAWFCSDSIQQAASNQGTLFVIPRFCMLTEGLVAVLQERRKAILWLRLDSGDCDPACCLLDITYAARRLNPKSGSATLSNMQRAPGPVYGWRPLFAGLGQEVGGSLPPELAVVLYGIPAVSVSQPALLRYISSFLEELPPAMRYILISHQSLPERMLPEGMRVMGVESLVVDAESYRKQAQSAGIQLSDGCRRRVVKLAGGFAPMLAGILDAGRMLGSDYLEGLVQRAANQERLLRDIARAFLSGASPETGYAVFLALRLGFYHADIGRAIWDGGDIEAGPWLQPLLDNWYHLRWGWREPLEGMLRLDVAVQRELQLQAAHYLAGNRAPDLAVPIYLGLEDYPRAVRVIEARLEDMMNYGQWITLRDWIDRIPESVLRDWPWLVYTRAEIEAHSGRTDQARGGFARAYQLFSTTQDIQGACQSSLAESALAVRQGDYQVGQRSALQAFWGAQRLGLHGLMAWTCWQLGCLAIASGNIESAVECFEYAAQCFDGAVDAEIIHKMGAFAQQYQVLTHESTYHREAYRRAQRALEEKKQYIRRVLSHPMEDLPCLLETTGWWKIPPMLKLPAAGSIPQENRDPDLRTRIKGFLRLFGLEFPTTGDGEEPAWFLPPLGGYPLPPLGRWLAPLRTCADQEPEEQAPAPTDGAQIEAVADPRLPPAEDHREESPAANSRVPNLRVYCLGPFLVYEDGFPVAEWPNGKGKSIFKYLISQRQNLVNKEVLMDLFWPGMDYASARNSLNVAIFGLRQVFRQLRPDYSHVLFQDDNYMLNPALRFWVDVEEFWEELGKAKMQEQSGDIKRALRGYQGVVNLYQGSFFEEDRYEDWMEPKRQAIQEEVLWVLERLCRYALEREDYDACILYATRMLAIESCQENAHRYLMRCYSNLGQHYLAVRQFFRCKECLWDELQVGPSPETLELYDQIRRYEGAA